MFAPILPLPSPDNNYHQEHVLLMLKNLKRWTFYDLIEEANFSVENLGEQVFNSDFYILSHNGEPDPVLNYGNRRVLELWEVSWEELTSMYSKSTAKPDSQLAREEVMRKVREQNYVNQYNGIRISKTGKEFKILDVTIWSLFADDGNPYGQAAWFRKIEFL